MRSRRDRPDRDARRLTYYGDDDRRRQLAALIATCDALLRDAAGQPSLDVRGAAAVRDEAQRLLTHGWSGDELKAVAELWREAVREVGRPGDQWPPRLQPDTPSSQRVLERQHVVRDLLMDLRSVGRDG